MSYSNKINCLLVGCSNLLGYHHAFADIFFQDNKLDCLNRYLDENYYNPTPDYDFVERHIENKNYSIDNYSKAGAGNEYIISTVQNKLQQKNYDYVFVQFSGLTRHDINENNKWTFSGGKNGFNAKNLEYFKNFYQSIDLKEFTVTMLSKCKNLLNELDKRKINYNWCFYYNIKDSADLEDHHPLWLDHSSMICPDPHTFCFSQKLGADDGYHFMYDGYREWLKVCKDQFCLNN